MRCVRWGGFVLLLFAIAHVAEAARRPNIVMIMADDLGYECIGANGCQSYKTPNLDALASGGARFDHCYVQPLCTPTRVQLMTGMYNVRNYVKFGLLDTEQTTFGNVLRDAGYVTGIVGKWQLGHSYDLPKHFGFDDYCLWQLMRRPSRYARPGLEVGGREIDYAKDDYGPDIVNQYAIDFITAHKKEPFFLYYPMMLTHSPFEATPDSEDWNVKLSREELAAGTGRRVQQRHFRDMVQYMDKLVGKLIGHLESLGLREQTLVLFIGDNGTGKGIETRMNDVVVEGGKGTPVDTGMHVPFIANWPGTIRSGIESHDLVDSTDFFPTICATAGAEIPSKLTIDGHNLLPQLKGEKGKPREWIYCWYSPSGGRKANSEFARSQNYKLYSDGRFFDVTNGDDDDQPIEASRTGPDGLAARQMLQGVLDEYSTTRPQRIIDGGGGRNDREE